MKRTLLWSLSLLLATSAFAQESPFDRGNYRVYKRHTNEGNIQFHTSRDTEILRRDPPFANLPFLKLREGDQLVRNQFFYKPVFKGVSNSEWVWSEPSLHLKRDGKYMRLNAYGINERAPLLGTDQIPLFHWDLTRANADALFRVCQPKPTVSVAQLEKLDGALQSDFAEYLGEELNDQLHEPVKLSPGFQYQVGEGNATKFVYAGFACDFDTRETFGYRLTFGADEWLEERVTLISAPPKPKLPPERRPQQMNMKNDILYQPTLPSTPAESRRLEAKITTSKKFDAVVKGVLGLPFK